MIAIRRMEKDELRRLAELDVSESGGFVYRLIDGRLEKVPERWHRPRWDAAECERRAAKIMGQFERGDGVLGAFDGDALVGLAVVRFKLTDSMAQLAGLWVTRSHRRRGVATMLTDEIERLARADGATAFYVSACPTESAVGFYSSHGFRPTDRPNPELLALEPEDIHMTKDL